MSNILLINPKFPHNIGGAVRALSCYHGGNLYFTDDRIKVADLKRLPREERMKAYSSVEWNAISPERPISHIERSLGAITPVAVELVPGSESLPSFSHPENALYIFGPEDGSLPKGIRTMCHRFVTIPSNHCLNLAAAVYIVLYDRTMKRVESGIEPMPSIENEERGWWHSPSLEESSR